MTGRQPRIKSFGSNLQLQMPLFFLLSGFSLTLGYGRTKYKVGVPTSKPYWLC